MVCISYFVFPFKNKTKISGDSNSFAKKSIFLQINNKKWVCHLEGAHACRNTGPQIKIIKNLKMKIINYA